MNVELWALTALLWANTLLGVFNTVYQLNAYHRHRSIERASIALSCITFAFLAALALHVTQSMLEGDFSHHVLLWFTGSVLMSAANVTYALTILGRRLR